MNMARKPAVQKSVEALTHDEAKRKNIPTAEFQAVVEKEQQESLAAVERLQKEICSHGLAVAGSRASLQALKCGQVDLLVMATEYEPEPAWMCTDCYSAEVQLSRPAVCPCCGGPRTRELDIKEELVRLAELDGCAVEIVHDSEILMRLGGAGCLLRFLSPDVYGRAAA